MPSHYSSRKRDRENGEHRRTHKKAATKRVYTAPGFRPTSRNVYRDPFPGETKYFDTAILSTITSGTNDWTGTEVPCDFYVDSNGTSAAYTDSALVPSAIGNAYGQVMGNRYILKKIRVRGSLWTGPVTAQTDVALGRPYRLMLVMDTQPNGLQAQGEDIMQDVGTSETLYSFKRMSAEGTRFRILKDQIGILQQDNSANDTTVGSVSNNYKREHFSFQYQPSSPIMCQVKSGSAVPTIGSVVNCNIFLLLHTQGEAISIEAAARCYYKDP